MIFNPIPVDRHQKVWSNYASFPTPAAVVVDSPPEVDPYDFGSSNSEADPERTTKQTTVNPWRTTPPSTAKIEMQTSPPSIAPPDPYLSISPSTESSRTIVSFSFISCSREFIFRRNLHHYSAPVFIVNRK